MRLCVGVGESSESVSRGRGMDEADEVPLPSCTAVAVYSNPDLEGEGQTPTAAVTISEEGQGVLTSTAEPAKGRCRRASGLSQLITRGGHGTAPTLVQLHSRPITSPALGNEASWGATEQSADGAGGRWWA